MSKSLKTRLGLLFAGFALLVMISIGATVWGLEAQRQDALIINLAGRQRMLAQQMARLAYATGEGQVSANQALQEAEHTFEQTLSALRNGGQAPYLVGQEVKLPATQSPEILLALESVARLWDGYRGKLEQLQNLPPTDPAFQTGLQSIQTNTSVLAQQVDEIVRLYEAESASKVERLRLIQSLFLLGAVCLLGVGALVTRRSVLVPLERLSQAAQRIGQHDLDSPVQVAGPLEFQALAQSFEAMRQNLQSSRRDLVDLNTSLEKRIRLRTQELEALNEISQEVNAQLELPRVLELVTEKARQLVGGEVAFLCLVDEGQRWLKLEAVSGSAEAVNPRIHLEADEPGLALENDQLSARSVRKCQGLCRALSVQYRASHLAVPLQAGERIIGALCVGSQTSGQFGSEAHHLLSRLANTAAVALENARLYGQAERMATLEERRRVAAEMHDGLGQTLSYLGLITDQIAGLVSAGQGEAALEHLRRAREAMQKATIEVRQAIDNLMNDAPLSTFNLNALLHIAVAEFTDESSPPVIWQSGADCAFISSRQVSEQVLNILREALKNAAKHARASQVTLQAGETVGHYFISVQDDGQGFDIGQPPPQGHFGLQVMRARAAVISGQIEIESGPGSGTQVTFIWPVSGKGKRHV